MRTQRGWVLFFIGILISTFLGGAIRFLFSPEFVREWIEGIVARTQPKFTFQFAEARLSLGRGWWPQLAVEFTDLQVKAKDPCITGAEIHADVLIVPLNPWDLAEGRVRFGAIEADRVSFYQHAARCEMPNVAHEADEDDFADDITPLEKFFQHRWNKEVVNTTRFVKELSVEEFRFFRADEVEPKFYLRHLQLHFFARQHEAQLRFEFWPGAQWAAGQPFGPTDTAIRITQDEVSWRAEGNLKEGRFVGQGQWFVDRGQYRLGFEWKDVPLTNFAALLYRWGYSDLSQFKTKNEWLSCQLESEGEVRKIAVNEIHLGVCEFYGDLGRGHLGPTKVRLAHLHDSEFVMSIASLDVRRLLDALEWEGLPTFIPKLGRFKGEVRFTLQRKVVGEGVVEGAEIYLGDLGMPVKRAMESAALKLKGEKAKFTADFSEIVMADVITPALVNVRHDEGAYFLKLQWPEVRLAKSWPLAAVLAEALAREEVKFKDVELSIKSAAFYPWEVRATLDAKTRFLAKGTIPANTLVEGEVTLTEGRKKTVFILNGELKEPRLQPEQ